MVEAFLFFFVCVLYDLISVIARKKKKQEKENE
jgi:hypothetical protein